MDALQALLAHEAELEEAKKIKAIIMIQCKLRAILARREFRKRKGTKDMHDRELARGATGLQSAFRGFKDSQKTQTLKLERQKTLEKEARKKAKEEEMRRAKEEKEREKELRRAATLEKSRSK